MVTLTNRSMKNSRSYPTIQQKLVSTTAPAFVDVDTDVRGDSSFPPSRSGCSGDDAVALRPTTGVDCSNDFRRRLSTRRWTSTRRLPRRTSCFDCQARSWVWTTRVHSLRCSLSSGCRWCAGASRPRRRRRHLTSSAASVVDVANFSGGANSF